MHMQLVSLEQQLKGNPGYLAVCVHVFSVELVLELEMSAGFSLHHGQVVASFSSQHEQLFVGFPVEVVELVVALSGQDALLEVCLPAQCVELLVVPAQSMVQEQNKLLPDQLQASPSKLLGGADDRHPASRLPP